MPFFSSLTHTGTRVGGLRERQTQSFESGVAYFPRDYPFTKAARQEEEVRAEEERETWERKPPAKRCNWEKNGTRSPWKPDWEVVLGLETADRNEDFVTTQRDSASTKKIRPWLFRGPDIATILSSASKLLSPSLALHSEINKLRLKRDYDLLDNAITADDLWKGALVRVQLKMCCRGSPGDLAVIYAVGDEEAKKWRALSGKRGDYGDEEGSDQVAVCLNLLLLLHPLMVSSIAFGDQAVAGFNYWIRHDRKFQSFTRGGLQHWCYPCRSSI
jgi:ribonuclease P/MRP protein subunit POP1